MQIDEMENLTIGRQRGRNGALAAKHLLLPEAGVQHVDVPKTIQKGNDDRVVSDRGRERLNGAVEIIGLAAQQYQIVVAFQPFGSQGRR